MDITRKLPTSKVSRSSQNDDRQCRLQNKAERTRKRPNHGSSSTEHHEQLQRGPIQLLPPGSKYFYPPLLPFPPSMSYMNFIRNLYSEQQQLNFLPQFEGLTNDKSPNEFHKETNNMRSQHTAQKMECDFPHCKDSDFSQHQRLCSTCEQHFRCICCQNPLMYLYPPPPFMYSQYYPVVPGICACQMQKKEITRKMSEPKNNDSKTTQTSLQSDQNNNSERGKTLPQVSNQERTCNKANITNETCDSSSSDQSIGQPENRIESYESEYESEEGRILGFCRGEGDKHDTNKSESKKKEKRRRSPVAYFIDI